MQALKQANTRGRTRTTRRQRREPQPQVQEPQRFDDLIDVEIPMEEEEAPNDEFRSQRVRTKQTKFIDLEGKEIERPRSSRPYNYQQTNTDHRFYSSIVPWMKQKNSGIFITGVNNTDIEPYSIKTIIYNNNGEIFYRINRNFKELMTRYRFKRTQIDNVLHVEVSPTKILMFKVGYLLPNGLVVQNNKIFTDEMNYFNMTGKPQLEKILDIRREPVTEEVINLGVKILSQSLHNVAPNVVVYGIYDKQIKRDTTYILDAIKNISGSKNIGEFMERLGRVVIFMSSIKFSKIFIERLREEYYLPDVLMRLPLSEKLPEVYDPNMNQSEEVINRMNDIITQTLKIFVRRMLTLIYIKRNPTERISGSSNLGLTPRIAAILSKVNEWRTYCVNEDNIPDNEIILYNENNKIYCMSIPEVVYNIENDDLINKHTGNRLSQKFIDYVTTYYNIKDKSEELVDEHIISDMEGLTVDDEDGIDDLDIEDLFSDLIIDDNEVTENEVNNNNEVAESEDVDMTVAEPKNKCSGCNKEYNPTSGYRTIDENQNQVEYCSIDCFNNI